MAAGSWWCLRQRGQGGDGDGDANPDEVGEAAAASFMTELQAAAWCSSGSEAAQEDELAIGDDVDAAGSVREWEGTVEAGRTCSLVRRRSGPKDVEARIRPSLGRGRWRKDGGVVVVGGGGGSSGPGAGDDERRRRAGVGGSEVRPPGRERASRSSGGRGGAEKATSEIPVTPHLRGGGRKP